MTTTYLGFFMNRQTREEFVAPVQAEDGDTAQWELEAHYPSSRFQLLTVYTRKELEDVLAGIERWPGLPNKVQAPVTTDLSRVRASTGSLPPLPGQVKAEVQPMTQAETPTVSRAAGPAPKIPAWMMGPAAGRIPDAAANPLEHAMAQRAAPTAQPVQTSLIERLKAAKGESMPAAPIRREPVREGETPISRAPVGSVIDILKGMRK